MSVQSAMVTEAEGQPFIIQEVLLTEDNQESEVGPIPVGHITIEIEEIQGGDDLAIEVIFKEEVTDNGGTVKEYDNKEKTKPKEHVKEGRVSKINRSRIDYEKQSVVKSQVLQDLEKHLDEPFVKAAYEDYKKSLPTGLLPEQDGANIVNTKRRGFSVTVSRRY